MVTLNKYASYFGFTEEEVFDAMFKLIVNRSLSYE